MNFYALSALINSFIFIFVVFALLIKKNKPRVAVYFIFFNLAALAWTVPYFFWQTSTDYEQALFWAKMLMTGAIFIAPTFLLFSTAVYGKPNKLYRILTAAAYILTLPFLYLDWTSASFIVDLSTKLGIHYFPTAGPAYYFYIAQWIGWVISAFFIMYQSWQQAEQEDKETKGVLFISTLIGFILGSVNYLLWFNIPMPPVTMLVVGLYGIAVTYLLFKGKFYRIHLYYFEFAAGVVVLISVLQFFLGQRTGQRLVNILTLIIIAFVSYFLLKVGERERQHLEKIATLNRALNDSIKNIINSINAAVLITGENENIIEANQRALKLFNHKAEKWPASYTQMVIGKTNRCLMEAIKKYHNDNTGNFACAIEAPDIKQVDVYFSPFTIKEQDDATIVIITEQNPPWGTIFNADTLKPVPLTIVRIYESSRQKLVASKVTDNLGRFDFIVTPGSYTITAEKEGYSRGVSKKQIGYQGEIIAIDEKNLEGVNVNILLDPQ